MSSDELRPNEETADNDPSNGPSQSLWPLFTYIALFFAAWIGWVLYVYPCLQLLDQRSLAYALANLTSRSLIWIAPVFVFVRYVDNRRPVEFLRLNRNWRRGIRVGLLFAALNLVGSIARFGLPHVRRDALTWNTILGTSCAIGLIEEIPFRGLILQKLEPGCGWLLANFISSLLFVCIHLPGWISLGTLRAVPAFTVFVLGLVFGVVFRYSGSLWSAVIAHSTNDFFAAVLFGV
jgi:CAAX protease family protein